MSTAARLAELQAWVEAQGYAPLEHNYGRSADQVADLTVPPGPGRHPVAVLVHGGFWHEVYDRRLMDALAVALAARDWATWNVEYRRGPGSGADGRAIADVGAAISMLRLIPAPLELRRVVVIGHSAGGQLALGTAAQARARRVVSLAGVADLVGAARAGLDDGAVQEFMGGSEPEQAPEAYAAADPLSALPTGARTLLVHGDADDRVPVSQSREYAAAARRAGDDAELLELPGVGHFELIDPRTPAAAAWLARLDG